MVSTRAGGRSLVAPDVITIPLRGETSNTQGENEEPPMDPPLSQVTQGENEDPPVDPII